MPFGKTRMWIPVDVLGGWEERYRQRKLAKDSFLPSLLNHPKAQGKMNQSFSFEHKASDQRLSELSLHLGGKVRTSSSYTVSVHFGVTYSKHPAPFLYFSELALLSWKVY